MAGKPGATITSTNGEQRSYEEIEPFCKWKRVADCETIEVHLPNGTKKEQLKVQINNHGVLTIIGECPLHENKWVRFRKEIKISKDCKTNEIRAKFTRGVLHVTMPKTNKNPIVPEQNKPDDAVTENKVQEISAATAEVACCLSNGTCAKKRNIGKRTAIAGVVVVILGLGAFLGCKYLIPAILSS